MAELWLSCYSTLEFSPDCLNELLVESQVILGEKIIKIGPKDPPKKIKNKSEIKEIINSLDFGENNSILGCLSREIDFLIKSYQPSMEFPNSVQWYFPSSYTELPENVEKVKSLLEFCAQKTNSFYSYCDFLEGVVSEKKRKDGFAVDIISELLGVFWLTTFNQKYIDFIGKDKLNALSADVNFSSSGHCFITLSDRPEQSDRALRRKVEEMIGGCLFVDPEDERQKERGEFGLTYSQLCCND